MFGKIKWKKKVKLFGFIKTVREFFWNGVIMLSIASFYRAYITTSKLPAKLSEMTKEEIDAMNVEVSFFEQAIAIILFLISYWMLNASLLSNSSETIKEKGALRALINAVLLIVAMLIVTTILQVIAVILIAY